MKWLWLVLLSNALWVHASEANASGASLEERPEGDNEAVQAPDDDLINELQGAAIQGDFTWADELFELSVFPYHTPELFSDMAQNVRICRDFMSTMLAHDVISLITEDDIMVSHNALCKFYANYVNVLGKNLKSMSESCFLSMADQIIPEHIPYIPIEFVRRNPRTFVTALDRYQYYTPEQIAVVTNVPIACISMNAERLTFMRTAEQFRMFRPMCLLHVQDFVRADLSVALSEGMVPGDFFAHYNGRLHENVWPHLTAKHIQYMGTELRAAPTSALRLPKITAAAAKGVTPDQFSFYLKQHGPGQVELVNGQWANFPKTIFNNLRRADSYVDLAIKLTHLNYGYMTLKQINSILKYPEACAYIPDTIPMVMKRRKLNRLKFSSMCFANMKPRLQYRILTADIQLPENILEHISSKHLLKMDYSIYTLNKLKSNNRKEIIRNLSSKVITGSHHACRLVKNIEVLQKMRIFRQEMPKKCWQHIGFKIKVKHILKAPKLFAGRPQVLKTLLKNEKKYSANFAKLSRRDMEKLTAGKAGYECRHFTRHQFKSTTGEQRMGLSPLCVASLPFVDDLQEDEVMHLKPNAFSQFTAKMASKLNFRSLFNHHLEHISEDVPVEETVGSLLTKDVLENQIGADRLSHLPARIWATVPPSAFTIFRDNDVLNRVSGSKMAYWRNEQVRFIPKNTLMQMNPDQAMAIGDLTKEKSELAEYLQRRDLKFDPEVRQALDMRFGPLIKSQSSASHLMNISTAMATAVLVTLALY